MKEIHLRRHAEKSPDGSLSDTGIQNAKELARHLPKFARVISSDSSRAQQTAKLLTGMDAAIDMRAGMYMANPETSEAINRLAMANGLTFLEAVDLYQDESVIDGIETKAKELNELIDELFRELKDDENALIVSHDISIIAAMIKRDISPAVIDPLEGYILKEDGGIGPTRQ